MEEIFENMGEDYEKFVESYEEFIEKLENKKGGNYEKNFYK